MPRYVAFLRAINVGGHVVKMDPLRKMFESIGCSHVETVIASGNVIFDSPSKSAKALEKKIEDHLRKKLGYDVATFLRTPAELGEVVDYRPFKSAELDERGNVLYIGFLPDAPDAAAKKAVTKFVSDSDDFHVHGREL